MKRKYYIFIMASAVTLLAGVCPPKGLKGRLFFYSGYYFVLAAVFLWTINLVKIHGSHIVRQLRNQLVPLLAAIALISAIFFMSPPQYKILNDEALLTGASLSFYNHKTAYITARGIFNETTPPTYRLSEIDKRPLLYPFCLSIIHSLTGFRAENSFILNFLSGVLLLFITYAWVAHQFDRRTALCAMLLMAGTPVFVYWITSAGFEAFSTLMILILFLFFWHFTENSTIENAEIFLMTAILVSQCRYESILFPAILFCFMTRFVYRHRYSPKWRWATCLAPLLMLPVIWQRLVFLNPVPKLMRGEIGHQAGYYSLDNLVTHFPKNIFVFLGINPSFGFTPVMAILGLIGLYAALRTVILNQAAIPPTVKRLFTATAISLIVFSALVFSHHFGDFSQPILNRLSFLYLPFFTFFAVYGLNRLVEKFIPTGYPTILLMPFLFLLVVYWPYGTRQDMVRFLTIKTEYAKTMDYLKTHFPNRKSTLIFCDRQLFCIINNFKSEDIRWANANQEYFWHDVYPFFDNVLFIQRYRYGEDQPMSTCRTAPSFTIKPLKKIRLSYKVYLVISKLCHPHQQP